MLDPLPLSAAWVSADAAALFCAGVDFGSRSTCDAFDATLHAEFLYACVRKTIEDDIPNETSYLKNFDKFRAGIEAMFDMPDRTLNNLFGFLRQNGGRLSKRARENEFAALTENEIARVENLYRRSFGVDASE